MNSRAAAITLSTSGAAWLTSGRTLAPGLLASGVLAGALGSLVLGVVVDRAGIRNAGGKFLSVAVLSLVAMVTLMFAFGSRHLGIALTPASQFGFILFGGFLATCTVGPAAAIVLDVIHPGVRSTGASVLSLFQNLFGLALGPLVGGVLSDAFGLDNALALTPLACIVAAAAFLMARGGYQADLARTEVPAVAQGAFA